MHATLEASATGLAPFAIDDALPSTAAQPSLAAPASSRAVDVCWCEDCLRDEAARSGIPLKAVRSGR